MPLNRSQVLNSLPTVLGTALTALAVWRWGTSADALPAILGVIAGGLVDQDHRLTGRLVNVLLTLCAFAFSSLAVQWSLPHAYLFVPTMTALTFGFTLLGAAGNRYRTVAFGTLAVATYTSLTQLPGQDWWLNTVLILAGTLLYSVITVLVHSLFPYRVAEEQLADSFTALGRYMQAKAQFFDPDRLEDLEQLQVNFAMQNREVTAQFNRCRRALYYRLSGQAPQEHTLQLTKQYFILQDVHERISSVHVNYRQLIERWQYSDLMYRIERLVEQQAQFCESAGAFVRQGTSLDQAARRLSQAQLRLQQSAAHLLGEQPPLALTRLLDNLSAINGQLLRLADAQLTDTQLQIAANEDETWRAALLTLRQNLGPQSAVFRHAVRLSVVVATSGLLVQALHLQLGYWILLTGLFVCQPSYTATRSKITQRILGTVLGVLVGSVMPVLVPAEGGRLLVIVLSTTLFFIFNSRRYSFSTFFITIEALTALSLVGFDLAYAVVPRIADTLAGSALAWLAVHFIWPDWQWLNLRQGVDGALKGAADYLQAIVQQHQLGRSDDITYRLSRRQAYERAAQLGDMVNEIELAERHYGGQARQGPALLAMMYGLLGQVSALGAARATWPAAQRPQLLTVARRLGELMASLTRLTLGEARQQLQQLSDELSALSPLSETPELRALSAQLHLIVDLLEAMTEPLAQLG